MGPFAVAGGDVTEGPSGWQLFRFGLVIGAVYGLFREPRAFACCGCLLALIAAFALLVVAVAAVVYWQWLLLAALAVVAWQLWVRRRR